VPAATPVAAIATASPVVVEKIIGETAKTPDD